MFFPASGIKDALKIVNSAQWKSSSLVWLHTEIWPFIALLLSFVMAESSKVRVPLSLFTPPCKKNKKLNNNKIFNAQGSEVKLNES